MVRKTTVTPDFLKLLYDGVNISELAKLFHKDQRDVKAAIREVEPAGERNGSPIWRVGDVAPYLVTPRIDFATFIKKMRPNDLPPMLHKEFWSALRIKQQYELEAGSLWKTEDVVYAFGSVFKSLREGILLFADQVENQTELTSRQRQVIQDMGDGLLKELRKKLLEGAHDREESPDGDGHGPDLALENILVDDRNN